MGIDHGQVNIRSCVKNGRFHEYIRWTYLNIPYSNLCGSYKCTPYGTRRNNKEIKIFHNVQINAGGRLDILLLNQEFTTTKRAEIL